MMLDPTVANLNTGSFGPTPRVVFERVTELRRRLAEEPMDFLVRAMPGHLRQARAGLGRFLHADPRRLIFTANVTTAINLVASGLTLASPGEILLTDHEYGAMHWCWERAAQRQGLTIRTFPLPILASDPGEIIHAARAAMTARTRLLFFSHVLSPTGLVLPAKELCAEARRRGIVSVVDGAHAPAMIPLDLDTLDADFYGANCHKWLLAPIGAGFLHLGRGSEDRLQPLQVSWGWRPERARLDEFDEFGSTPRVRFYEFEGTRDICPWLAVPAALDFQQALGFNEIRAHNARLVERVRTRFAHIQRLAPATPTHPDLCGFLTAFRLPPHVDGPTWRKVLWERYRIEAPIIDRPEGLLIRVSTHFYNTEEEIERIAEAVEWMLANT
ncbi:MAG: aminotransferase class V-fold PLP-dependent enzyme [Planctomycetes bacterium]|nr:aminotransferase class V-fold PLP-dependent enzyme [Planctomycetota bacterium]